MDYADLYDFGSLLATMGMYEGAMMISNIIYVLYVVTVQLLLAIGLYTIAKRRGLRHPWLAFLPVGSSWILGSIADQYHYVTSGAIRNRRKLLIGLDIAGYALLVFLCACIFAIVVIFLIVAVMMLFGLSEYEAIIYGTSVSLVTLAIGSTVIIAITGIMMILAIILGVFSYICYYDLFQSCVPEYKVLYLVLGIVTGLLPLFVFVCRNKDLGMQPKPNEISR